jgi:hypothetical protein
MIAAFRTEAGMSARNRIVVLTLLAFGLAFRSYHYLRCPSMWHDEAAAVVNVLNRDFVDLLGPLSFHEAAPPLFLWVEKAASLALGDGECALRLPSFLASCGALCLFAWVAVRLLSPGAVAWAVLLFAFSEQLAWHACEAKPYSFDVLAAVGVLAVHAGMRNGAVAPRLLVYTGLAPVLIFLSYPACFLFGGVLAANLPAVWRERRAAAWLAYGVLAVAVVVCFGALVLGPVRAQHDVEMTSCWTGFFPDWSRPRWIPAWATFASLDVLRYCFKPLGMTLAPLAVVGAVASWRNRARAGLVLAALPVGLALVASFLNRYPFGGARVMVYVAPAIALLAAAGSVAVMDWLIRLGPRWQWAAGVVVLILASPIWNAVQSVVRPWPRADAAGAAGFVASHRLPSDAVAGNNWTHLYYFRRLGPAFHWLEQRPAADADDDRCWIVYTEEVAAEKRMAKTLRFVPPGWEVRERREFQFTTVVLAASSTAAKLPTAARR